MVIKDFYKYNIRDCKKVGQKACIEMAEDDPMYCCGTFLKYYVNDHRVPISYSPAYRKYYFMVEKELHAIEGLIRCLQCNKKWPKDLGSTWRKTINKELKFDPYEAKNNTVELPAEFTTDEWWKKRGL